LEDFFEKALAAMHEVLIDKKVSYEIVIDKLGQEISRPDRTKYTLRNAYENTLLQRLLYAFFVDEAPAILKKKREETNRGNMDIIKSLADKTKTTHVLIGTHELLDLIDNQWSAQLDLRTQVIPLRRYIYEKQEDKSEWERICRIVNDKLIMPADFNLEANAEYFARNTHGLVGMFMKWCAAGQRSAYLHGRKYLKTEDMETTVFSEERLQRELEEIVKGEDRVIKFLPVAQQETDTGPKLTKDPGANLDTNKPPRKPRPGTRTPGSDPIGVPPFS